MDEKLLFSVASYWNAQDQALNFNPDIAISILEPGARSPDFGIEPTRHLRIAFNDIEASEIGRIAPSLDHIKTIINFTEEQKSAGARRLMVHCMAGVSPRGTLSSHIAESMAWQIDQDPFHEFGNQILLRPKESC